MNIKKELIDIMRYIGKVADMIEDLTINQKKLLRRIEELEKEIG